MESYIRAALLSLAVGDALGVPYEFLSRYELRQSPCTNMRGYGTHEQPQGTWSDDSTLAFCLAGLLPVIMHEPNISPIRLINK